jgi:hypothetical protein
LGMRVLGDRISKRYPMRIRPVKTKRKLICMDSLLHVQKPYHGFLI